MFALMYYMGFTYRDVYTLPVWQRNWFLERLMDEIKRSNGDSKNTTKENRALMNKQRPEAPHRVRRFT